MSFLISCFSIALQFFIVYICFMGLKTLAKFADKGCVSHKQGGLKPIKTSEVTGLELAKQKLQEHICEAHAVGAYILAEKYMKQLEVVKAIQRAQEAKIKAEKQSEWANKAEQALDNIYD